MDYYSVGQIAKKVDLNVETLRYYEKIRLMPKPKRKESRYRFYTEDDLTRLLFIKRAKELGFTLKEIGELLSIKIDSEAKCGDVKHLAENKISDIDGRIADLKKIKNELAKLVQLCKDEKLTKDDCPIVKALEPVKK